MQQEVFPKSVGRTPCCSKIGLNRGPWTPDEDLLLTKYIQAFGEGRWRTLPKKAGLQRCGKSCRLRWMNYLRPDVKRGYISPDEEDLILRLHRLLGNRWSLIAGRIPGRTDNEIKNYWNTHLSKQLISQGIDPRTHKPLSHPIENPTTITNTNTPERSGDKPDPTTVKRISDSVDHGNQDCDHQVPRVRKKHKVEYMNAVSIPALNYNEQPDMIDWKYHVKAPSAVADHHLFSVIDPGDREAAATLMLNNMSINIPCMEALESGLLNHGCSPYNFINNPAITNFDIQSMSNLCSDHCNPISHSAVAVAPAPSPSINKLQFNEYEGNMLFDRRYHVPKAEVFMDQNGSTINGNGIHQVYPAPNSNQDCYGPYILDSMVHDQDLLLNNFNTSSTPDQSLQQPENPNSAGKGDGGIQFSISLNITFLPIQRS